MHVIESLSQSNHISVTFWAAGFFFLSVLMHSSSYSKSSPVMIHHETRLFVSAVLVGAYFSFTHSQTDVAGEISFISVIK